MNNLINIFIAVFLFFLSILICIPNISFAQEFKKAQPNYELAFPRDHGAHRNYETEWWYFTGLLKSNNESYKYGFQLTFFRRANKTNANDWHQAYLAHAAISNFETNNYHYNEKLASAGLGIAGASESELKVWNHNWRAEKIGEKLLLSFDIKDKTEGGESMNKCEIRLISNDIPSNATRIIKNGDNAYSKKGNSGASIYYSMAPIKLDGHINCEKGKEELRSKELVSGKAWMDHEFMTNALSKDQVGWDWISLNFNNNDTLMLFRLRDKKGKANYKSGN